MALLIKRLINLNHRKYLFLILIAFIWCGSVGISLAQYSFKQAPLNQILERVQEKTDFYFLYRKSLTSGIRLSLDAEKQNILDALQDQLRKRGLALEVDSTRNQAIIYQQKKVARRAKARKKIKVSGQVVDATSEDRLPFATIVWKVNGSQSGVSTNESGIFSLQMQLPDTLKQLSLKCSYVGYSSKIISLDISKAVQWNDVTFRLNPSQVSSSEVVITGRPELGDLDTTTNSYAQIGTMNPMGASNTMSALQVLPSVAFSTAMSKGVHVRGSDTDGFKVLLDGVTIYNQSHLFGLLDSFNSDVLKRNALYYDVTPARYQASPGGTLSLLTRTGSLNRFSAKAGITNTSARLTLDGPLKKGKSSFLLSGRLSFMNALNWFDNASLIEWGLDVDRSREVLADGLVNAETQLVRPGDSDASFFDLHGKLNFESRSGNRLIISGYYGGDDTRQDANRLFRSYSASEGVTVKPHSVSSTNNWSNGAASVRYQWWLSDNIYALSSVGTSVYRSTFSKDDFTYTNLSKTDGSLRIFTYPFENESVLNEVKADQQFDAYLGDNKITAGVSYYYYLGEYFEDSFDRSEYLTSREAHRFDVYAELDYSPKKLLNIHAGARTHYYYHGDKLYLSPRFKLRLFPESVITIGGGYSRNFQFLNQVSLDNTVTADVWVLNGKGQPPTTSDNYSAHFAFKPHPLFYLQVEGYLKDMQKVRLHELNTYSLGSSFSELPWLINNNGTSKGLEFLLRNHYSLATLTQTFTLSRTRLSNPEINEGKPFFVNWDRTYQYSAVLKVNPVRYLSLFLSWRYASGAANKLAIFGNDPQQRLDDYQRADLSIRYHNLFDFGEVRATFSLFNLFNRQNPWYRDLAYVIDRTNNQTQFKKVPVDVYGLGFRPSFNLSVGF